MIISEYVHEGCCDEYEGVKVAPTFLDANVETGSYVQVAPQCIVSGADLRISEWKTSYEMFGVHE